MAEEFRRDVRVWHLADVQTRTYDCPLLEQLRTLTKGHAIPHAFGVHHRPGRKLVFLQNEKSETLLEMKEAAN